MSRTLQPEDQISHYRVVGPLGAGGMGEVYIAQDETLERSVALKVLPTHLVKNEERVRRFITEAKSASSLNHPNIVTIYEIGQEEVKGAGEEVAAEAVHFISMELVSGDTLTEKIHHEKTDLRTLLGYLAQAAEGVAKAHAAGIVHRDLKPGNIMVSKDGFAKVLDFGLAKLTERQDSPGEDLSTAPTEISARTGEGVIMGTVGYMSPEQVKGKSVDHRSDIFSLGCILYEATTRRRPFAADTDVETMHQILRDKPQPVEELNPEAPAAVRRLIRRCLAKNAEQRFQSMKDVAIELRELMEEYESLSPSGASASSFVSGGVAARPRRGVGFVVGVTATILVGIAGLTVGMWSLLSGRETGPASGGSFQTMQMSVLMSRNDLVESTLSADGRYLAYISGVAGRVSLRVRQVRTGSDVEILPTQELPISSVSFSPDGDYLYYRSRDPESPNYSVLYQVASLGGKPRKRIFDVDTAVAFSPDGRRVCFRRGLIAAELQADSLVIADLESGEERELARVLPPEFFGDRGGTAPSWSPDGATIAMPIQKIAGGAESRVVTIDVESGEMRTLGSKRTLFLGSLAWLPDGSGIVTSQFDLGSQGAQLWLYSYPNGDVRRITNDLDAYEDVNVSADGEAITTMRERTVTNLWVSQGPDGGDPAPLTFATSSVDSVFNALPLADGSLIFVAMKDRRAFLWRIERDGSDRREISPGATFVFNVHAAQDGVVAFNEVDENESFQVWTSDADGGGRRQLTESSGMFLEDLAPDGRTALVTIPDQANVLFTIPTDGGEAETFIDPYSGGAEYSPAGDLVLYSRLEEVQGRMYPRRVIIPASGGDPVGTLFLPPATADLKWSPDGKALSYIDTSKGFNVMRQPIGGGDPEPVTEFTEGRILAHNWSPDGRRLSLVRRIDDKESLWSLSAEGGDPVLVADFRTGRFFGHRWVQDSQGLAFAYGQRTQEVVMIEDFR